MDINIIAQKSAVVNINITDSSAKINIKTARRLAKGKAAKAEREADDKKPALQRWNDHKVESIKIGDRMIEAGLRKRGWRIKVCGTELIFDRCADCGEIMLKSAMLCRDRLCPLCSWRLAVKRYAAMSRVMAYLYASYPRYCYSLVCLTAANCAPSALRATLKSMQQAWHECLKQRWARKHLEGWARAIEVTHNAETDMLHPHYHIIIMSQSPNAAKWLVDEWLDRADREGLKVSAEAQYSDVIDATDHKEGKSLAGAVAEVYKYSLKTTDTATMPLGTLRALAEGLSGLRLISMGGLIKTAAALLEADDLEEATDEAADKPDRMCTRCKSQRLDEIILTWSMAGNQYQALCRDKGTQKLAQEIIDHRRAHN